MVEPDEIADKPPLAGVDGGAGAPEGDALEVDQGRIRSGLRPAVRLFDPPMDARRRWLKRCCGWDWRTGSGLLSKPAGVAAGKLDSASRKGGIWSSGATVPGVMDLMPTMMMGTMRPSLPSPSPSWLFPAAAPPPWCSDPVPAPRGLFDDPKRNMRKKFNGTGPVASGSPG